MYERYTLHVHVPVTNLGTTVHVYIVRVNDCRPWNVSSQLLSIIFKTKNKLLRAVVALSMNS